MNAYERIMEVIRKQGRKGNSMGIQLASVGEEKVKLDSEDYLRAEGVSLQEGDVVLIYQFSDDQYIAICKVVE